MAADVQDLPEFPRLTNESLNTIRARMMANVNLGVDPGSPSFLDALLGSIWADLEIPVALELDEYFDFANEVARAIMPVTTYGRWLDGWAESVGLERKDVAAAGGILRFTGPNGTVITSGTTESTLAAAPDAEPVSFATTEGGTIAGGFVDLAAEASEPGSVGNVPAGTVTELALEISGVTVSNPSPMTSGADVETDDALRQRVLLELSGEQGAGNQADYIRWGLEDAGVGFVTVEPAFAGGGTVRMFLTDPNNDPAAPAVLTRVKLRVDPVDGQGLGLAPIGAAVTVAAPVADAVDVGVTGVVFDSGYSLDGAGGTIAIGDDIATAIRTYINSRPVGGDIIRSKLIAAIVDVVGAADVPSANVTVNAATTGNTAIAAGHVAFADDVTVA